MGQPTAFESAVASVSKQIETIGSAPLPFAVLLAVLAVLLWQVFKYVHGERLDRIKQDADSEKRESERLRNRLAEIEAHGAPTTPLQIELEVWCRHWLDPAFKQAVEINKILEEKNPWADLSLQRSALADLATDEKFVPSEKVSNAHSLKLAQEFFLDCLKEYNDQADGIHFTQRHALQHIALPSVDGYVSWRKADDNLLRALGELRERPEFQIIGKRLPNEWGKGEREHEWPKGSG